MKKVILQCNLCPGDVVLLTGAVRDLKLAYPEQFRVDVRTPYPSLWQNNPYLTPLHEDDPEVEVIDCEYPLIKESNTKPYHCLHGFCQFLNEKLGTGIGPSASKGDLHLSEEEKRWYSQVHELTGQDTPYWIIVAGGKQDVTIKWWQLQRWQSVVKHFCNKILFVQAGLLEHNHPPLEGVIDLRGKTDLRQLIRLVYHAQGVLCPVTFLMHLAAAVVVKPGMPKNRACVVVAGGREPMQWEAYPHHQFIHCNGALLCCDNGGCWKSRITPLGDGDQRDKPEELCLDVVNGLPRCMDIITSEDVIRRIELYFQGGGLKYLKGRQSRIAADGIQLTQEKGADVSVLEKHAFRKESREFIKRIPKYPATYLGRGIVICAGGDVYFGCAWVAIKMLRKLGCQLPIQVWHLGEKEIDDAMREIVAPLGVECVDALKLLKDHPARRLRGKAIKLYATLHCRFKEVLLLDADTIATKDPTFLFETTEFRRKGAVLWEGEQLLEKSNDAWNIFSIRSRDAQCIDGSQVIINKQKLWRVLNLALFFDQHEDFFRKQVREDSLAIQMAFFALRREYAIPATLAQSSNGCVFQHDFQGRRIFQHRKGPKWHVFGDNPSLKGFEFEQECRAFLEELRRKSSVFGRWLTTNTTVWKQRNMLKLSYCITCMGRLHHLKRTLPANIAANRDFNVEFVVLDYNSRDGLGEWIRKRHSADIECGKLIYARTDEPSGFHQAHAKNLSHRLATGDILCNLDADNYATSQFTEYLLDLFSSRERVVTRGQSGEGFFGRIALPKFWFYRMGGYDEELVPGYGNEDNDAYERGSALGLASLILPEKFAKVIAHSDEERLANLIVKNWNSTTANGSLSLRKRLQGKYVANQETGWGKAKLLINFKRSWDSGIPSKTFISVPTRASGNKSINPCLVTVASNRTRHFNALMSSCKRFDIKPIILGMGQDFHGNARKIVLLKDFAEREGAWYSHILFCDAYDVVLAAGFSEIFERYEEFDSPILFSAEVYCFPDPQLQDAYPQTTGPYKYLNSGVWMGETTAVRQMFHKINTVSLKERVSDQGIFTNLFLTKAAQIALDSDCRIAQSLNGATGDLLFTPDGIRNLKTGQSPLIFHGNGGSDLSRVVEWLNLGD